MAETRNDSRITNTLLNGTNYMPWSRAVTVALGGKGVLDHINGTTAIPKSDNPKYKEWQTRDHYVMSLIFNAMEPQVYEIFAYADTAKNLWDSILEMYGNINNASRVFELQQQLSQIKQTGNQTVTEYLGKMKKRWEELRQYRPVAPTVQDYLKREEEDKIFQFLAGLSSNFEDTKRDILSRIEQLPFTTICSIVQREETRRRTMSTKGTTSNEVQENSAFNSYKSDGNKNWNKGKEKKRFHCDYCKRDGHTKDRCWELYPNLQPTKPRSASTNQVSSEGTGHRLSAMTEARQSDSDNSDIRAKLEQLSLQMEQFMKSHGAGGESVNVVKGNDNVCALATNLNSHIIIDSGATDHMFGSENKLSHISSNCNYSHVTVANGVTIPTKGMGRTNVFQKKTYAVIVPDLKTNLLSVSIVLINGTATLFSLHRK